MLTFFDERKYLHGLKIEKSPGGMSTGVDFSRKDSGDRLYRPRRGYGAGIWIKQFSFSE